MDLHAQLSILQAAAGHPALIALCTVDLTHHTLPAERRVRLREALLAAAVPHWCDAPFLAALLDTSAEEAAGLLGELHVLNNVEAFPARGPDAVNVHDASRLALREYLRTEHADFWKLYAQRAREHVASGTAAHLRIEALFHLFAADVDAAVEECVALDANLRENPETRAALSLCLKELAAGSWLSRPALVETKLLPLWHRVSRGEASELEAEALEVLGLAETHAERPRMAIASKLVGVVNQALGRLPQALAHFSACAEIFDDLRRHDPDHGVWQRELASARCRQGEIHADLGDLEAAEKCVDDDLRLLQSLTTQSPDMASWRHALGNAWAIAGDIRLQQGRYDEARSAFSESLRLLQALVQEEPHNALRQRSLAIAHQHMGCVHAAMGAPEPASQDFQKSLHISQLLVAVDPSCARWQRGLALALHGVGLILSSKEDQQQHCRLAIAAMKRSVAACPRNAGWQQELQNLQRWQQELEN